ncbi:hypothetical protein C8035_v009266 [Colletotrichum spinosum]|uniref:Uncharacterized protein n=1 Tax=Colletotrichum spinosum TaxID=1347390 RepID=A0A4R8Q5Y2_9PEZI|nr:hypothetical protein C8035_v009266 [Colletotrichum spinosum]
MRYQAIAASLFAMLAAAYAEKCSGKFCGTLDCGTLPGNPSCVTIPDGCTCLLP